MIPGSHEPIRLLVPGAVESLRLFNRTLIVKFKGRWGHRSFIFCVKMPVKRGLVAPQNIFIQTILKKFDNSRM